MITRPKNQPVSISNNKNSTEFENYVKRFCQFIPLPAAISNSMGEILFLNDKFTDIFGYKIEELRTVDHWFSLAYPEEEYRNAARKIWTKDIEMFRKGETQEPPVREYKINTKFNLKKNIEISFHIEDEIFIVIFNDISSIRTIEKRLRKQIEFSRKIVQTSPLGIFSLNRKREIVFLNSGARKLLKLEKGKIIGKKYKAFEWEFIRLDGSALPGNETAFDIVYTSLESLYNYRHGIKWADGSIRFFEINASPVIHRGEFDGIVATIEDITHLLEEEENLRIVNKQLKESQALSKLGSWINYFKSNEVIWSEETYNIFGYRNNEVSPKEIFLQHIHPDDQNNYIKITNEVIQNDNPIISAIDFRIIDANGIVKHCKSRAEFILDNHGKRIGVWGTIQDVSESKKIELELKELNQTKDKILSVIAHDLRSPVSNIVSISELLLEAVEEGDLEKIKKYTGLIRKTSNKSDDLLTNLLDWARLQKTKTNYHPEKIGISELINEVLEFLSQKLEEKNIEIEIELIPDYVLMADRNMLSTVLRNLISNALKFTHKNGKVSIKQSAGAGKSIFCITDNGVGIDPKVVSKLFNTEAFHSSPGTENETGTGLGLKICKDFVEVHKGEIWVESMASKGASFYFSIPE